MTTPLELFETIRERAVVMLKAAFMESGKPWPADDDPIIDALLMPVLGVGIAATCEYFTLYPEHLALAASPICTTCREPIQTLQVGADPANDGEVSKVAWPCGHHQ